MRNKVRTRFAPSPTGYMHIGNLRTALFAFLFTRANGGDFILRIEDTDQGRLVSDAVDVIYDTLKISGLTHDEGPDVGGQFGPYIQSERKNIYKQYAEQLVAKGEAYYCFCDKNENIDPKNGYNRHCRSLSKEEIQFNIDSGKPYVIRQKVPMSGTTMWNDLVYGPIAVENNILDDQILIKSDGMPTYNFANVIDDHLMRITHIIRGSEYLSSNPKYILLYRAFGWNVPSYIHLPLINGKNPDGTISKLSKRHGAVSFQALVADGYLPSAIINYIALLGWAPKDGQEIFDLPVLISKFSIDGVHKNPAIFDYDKLDWVNSQHIAHMTDEDFVNLSKEYCHIENSVLEPVWDKIAKLLKPRISKLSEIPSKIGFLTKLEEYNPDLFINKKNKSTYESSFENLLLVKESITPIEKWCSDNLYNTLLEISNHHDKKIGQILWPVRIALSGLQVTPGGATELLEILGKEESLSRIERALCFLKKCIKEGC